MTEIPVPLEVEIKKIASPVTTVEENLHSASQRKINLIWEYTQMAIALMVVISTMIAGVYLALTGLADKQIPTILSVAFGTVVGFYFGRTNHQTIGGVQLGR
jgi:hypothetical protein